MIEHDQESLEQELRRMQPARLPDDFAQRLEDARADVAAVRPESPARTRSLTPARLWLRWLAPAAVMAGCAVALVSLRSGHSPDGSSPAPDPAATPALRADQVEIDRQLVADFDALATLPDGEPVRVRCREWLDEVVLRDTERGVAIQRRTPRMEIIPVSYETF